MPLGWGEGMDCSVAGAQGLEGGRREAGGTGSERKGGRYPGGWGWSGGWSSGMEGV